MDLANLLKAIQNVLPLLEVVAKMTRTKLDDLAVMFLKSLVQDSDLLSTVVDRLKAKGFDFKV